MLGYLYETGIFSSPKVVKQSEILFEYIQTTYITNVYCPEIEERLVKHARNVTKYALLTWHVTHYEYFSIFKN